VKHRGLRALTENVLFAFFCTLPALPPDYAGQGRHVQQAGPFLESPC